LSHRTLHPVPVVNEAVFKALDHFDYELSGETYYEELRETVTKVFADFRVMRDRSIREEVAGSITGRFGTDNQEIVGYINVLKNSDAQVQWCLFMPETVKRQQNGS